MGAVLGGLHSGSLWMAARQPSALVALTGILRLLVIAIVLIASAFSGGIIPTRIGWGRGYLTVAVFCLARGMRP